MFNLLLFGSFVIILFDYSHPFFCDYIYGKGTRALEKHAFEWLPEGVKLVASAAILDVWFYLSHRLLHTSVLYHMVHWVHHTFKAPVAVASMYAHPIEFMSNLLGILMGPYVTNAHPFVTYFWITMCFFTSGAHHSGYVFFASQVCYDIHFLIQTLALIIIRTLTVGSKPESSFPDPEHMCV